MQVLGMLSEAENKVLSFLEEEVFYQRINGLPIEAKLSQQRGFVKRVLMTGLKQKIKSFLEKTLSFMSDVLGNCPHIP